MDGIYGILGCHKEVQVFIDMTEINTNVSDELTRVQLKRDGTR
jgi:hypothetical protein